MRIILGTINKRIDVGIEGNQVFIVASSNMITFNTDELVALSRVVFHVLDCEFNIEEIRHRLEVRKIVGFEPSPPPATITV